MSMMETLLTPFQFGFMVNALIISALVAVPMALLSCFLVLKGWSLMGEAISHAVFPGVAIACIVGLPYAIGAFVAGMFCAVATGFLKDNSRTKQDTMMGIVFSGMFGFGLLHYGMLCLISLTIVGALKAVGLILAIGMLVASGAIAFLLGRTFAGMLVVALSASLLGVYLSFFLDSAPAPTIVLLMSVMFIAAFIRSSLATRRVETELPPDTA